jgi:glycosyltransferase involved in cell wall biosynthesis
LRILHLIATLDPDTGGPPAVALRLAAAQAGLGHQVSVGAHDPRDARQRVNDYLKTIPGIDKVAIVDFPATAGLNRITAANCLPDLRKHLGACDFLHIHGVWEPLLLRASKVARAKNVAYTVTPHGMLDPWSLSQRRLKKRVALALGYRSMLRGVAFLHLLNRDEESLIGPLGLNCPGEVIPNGMFLEELDPLPDKGAFHALHPELKGMPFILFMSRLHYKKGLDYLADAFADLAREDKRTRLVVAGPDGGARNEFEKQIADHGLTDRVHLTGPVYGDEKSKMLSDAWCFCLPSRQEGFSMAITEAMACRLPVLISKNCHFPEVAEAGAGRVLPLNASEFAQALKEVMSDASLRRSMGDAGRALVEARYTWQKVAEQSIATYERAIERRRRSR